MLCASINTCATLYHYKHHFCSRPRNGFMEYITRHVRGLSVAVGQGCLRSARFLCLRWGFFLVHYFAASPIFAVFQGGHGLHAESPQRVGHCTFFLSQRYLAHEASMIGLGQECNAEAYAYHLP